MPAAPPVTRTTLSLIRSPVHASRGRREACPPKPSPPRPSSPEGRGGRKKNRTQFLLLYSPLSLWERGVRGVRASEGRSVVRAKTFGAELPTASPPAPPPSP